MSSDVVSRTELLKEHSVNERANIAVSSRVT